MTRKMTMTAAGIVAGVIVTATLRVGPFASIRSDGQDASRSSDPHPVSKRSSARSALEARYEDPIKRLKSAPEDEFSEALGRVVSAWNEEKLAHDVDDLFMRPGIEPPLDELRLALLRRWTSASPEEAARWAVSLARDPDRASAFDQIVLAWSASDPNAAFGWLKSLPEDPIRNQAWNTLAYDVSREQPAKAFEMALPLIGTPDGARCIEHAVANWALLDPGAALARVRDLSDPSVRNSALASLATSWSESDPSAAGTLVSEAMEPGPIQKRAVASIVQRWAQQDPAAATSWVASFFRRKHERKRPCSH